jgi:hypothetical protein
VTYAFRTRSTIARPADVTAYAAGDEISNSAAAGSVVRATFDLTDYRRLLDGKPFGQRLLSGRIIAAEIDLTAASGNVVTTAADIELLIFRTGDVPAAVGDNVTNPIAAATRALAPARFRFDDTGWTGTLGTVAAATSQSQAVMATLVQPLATNVLEYPHVYGFPFSFGASDTVSFTAVLRALAAWTPGAVINTFGITLDFELNLE